MNHLAPITASHAPAIIAASGARASYRFLEFFTANIRNPHTRRAYARAATEFFDWLEARGVTQLAAIESVHVAAYMVVSIAHEVDKRSAFETETYTVLDSPIAHKVEVMLLAA
jgi:hypothetical protein